MTFCLQGHFLENYSFYKIYKDEILTQVKRIKLNFK